MEPQITVQTDDLGALKVVAGFDLDAVGRAGLELIREGYRIVCEEYTMMEHSKTKERGYFRTMELSAP